MCALFQTLLRDLDGKIFGGLHISTVAFSLGVALLLLAYLNDLMYWRRCYSLWVRSYAAVAGLVFLVGLMYMSLQFPSILPLLGASLIAFSARTIRTGIFYHDEEAAILGNSLALICLALLLFVSWCTWAMVAERGLRDSFDSESTFIEVWSPFLISAVCSVMSLFGWMRCNYQARQSVASRRALMLPPQLKVAVAVIVAILIVMWVGAELAFQAPVLSSIVARFAVVVLGGVFLYILDWWRTACGSFDLQKTFQAASEGSGALQNFGALLMSDWMKGLFVLLFGPLLPLFVPVEAVHQFMRTLMQRCGFLDGFTDPDTQRWVTREASDLWATVTSWDLASVLSKAIYVGIAYISLQVGVNQVIVIFLAWFNETVAGWTKFAAFTVLWVVEISLFLFPPVSGIPLYLIAGLVIIAKLKAESYGLWLTILASTLYCWALKLTATALEQKCIGEPFSNSIAVKKFIGTHTSFMKAIRFILSMKRLSMAKVAVLCGGPDWPTSVITGILGLPLGPMLFGTLPVVVLIFPVCVAAALRLEVRDEDEGPASGQLNDRNRWFSQAATIVLAVAAIMQCLASLLAAYFAQLVMDDFEVHVASRGSSWQQDPQEVQVLDAVAAEERAAQEMKERVRWAVQPCIVRASLLLGTLLASTSFYLVINPVVQAFAKVDITDKVSKLDRMVYPAGWCAIGSLCGCIFCLSVFEAWKGLCSVSPNMARSRSLPHGIELQPQPRWEAGCNNW